MTFCFDCDCTYVARVRLLFRTVRERGAYRVEDDRLPLPRASGEVTSWPFELDGDELMIEEHESETHAYERKAVYRRGHPCAVALHLDLTNGAVRGPVTRARRPLNTEVPAPAGRRSMC